MATKIREISDAPLSNPEQMRAAIQDMMKRLNEVIKELNRISQLVP